VGSSTGGEAVGKVGAGGWVGQVGAGGRGEERNLAKAVIVARDARWSGCRRRSGASNDGDSRRADVDHVGRPRRIRAERPQSLS